MALAKDLCRYPQEDMRADRISAFEGWGRTVGDAMRAELERGVAAGASAAAAGAARFAAGKGRHGDFTDI